MTLRRKVCLAMTLCGAVGFGALAFALVPWDPAPGGWPEPARASDVFTAEQINRGEAYARWSRVLSWSSLLVSAAVACWLGFTSRGARLLGGRTSKWPLQVIGLSAVILLIGQVATLPLSLAFRQRRVDYGLTEQTLTDWAVDLAKNYLLGLAVTSIALLVLVGCARRWQTWWPAIARSEEHTSELQSLMRLSYAVFCLKKKKTQH